MICAFFEQQRMVETMPGSSGVPRVQLGEARALVAGAGQGIGGAIARAAAASGAHVHCVDIDSAAVRDTAEQIIAAGGTASWACADLLAQDGIDAAVAGATTHLGGIDVVVDVLGRAAWGAIVDIPDDVWDESFAINVRQSFRLTRAVGRAMVAQGTGGAIVHVTSINALTGYAGNGAGAAAKAALRSLVQTAALEFGPSGVRVNAVAPGAVETPRLMAALDQDYWAAVKRTIPLGRAAQADDVAAAALFLMSDLSRYVTGHTLVVDGGLSAKFPLSSPADISTAPSRGTA
jgi:3-oxoacyl-[acyl-carrier protein] reductase